MKFESFAVTSNSGSGDNQENYFLNGFCKDNISDKESFVANLAFGKKDMYAVSDGSAGDESGGEAAFIAVNLLRDFLGSDFTRTYSVFFDEANREVAGRIFENEGKKEFADMAVLYVNRRKAVVYNIGESSVFISEGDKLKKVSGKVPATVEIEDSSLDAADNLIINRLEKKTVKLLGEDSDDCEVYPYISDEIKITGKKTFLLCSKQVTDNVSEDEIREILKDRGKPVGKAASELIHKAVNDGGHSDATVVLVRCKNGFNLAWLKSKVFVFIVFLLMLVLIGFASRDSLSAGLKNFMDEYVWDDKMVESIELDPWVPKSEEEMFGTVENEPEKEEETEEAEPEKEKKESEPEKKDVQSGEKKTQESNRNTSQKTTAPVVNAAKSKPAAANGNSNSQTSTPTQNEPAQQQNPASAEKVPENNVGQAPDGAKNEVAEPAVQEQAQQETEQRKSVRIGGSSTDVARDKSTQNKATWSQPSNNTQTEQSGQATETQKPTEQKPVQSQPSTPKTNVSDSGGLPIDFN